MRSIKPVAIILLSLLIAGAAVYQDSRCLVLLSQNASIKIEIPDGYIDDSYNEGDPDAQGAIRIRNWNKDNPSEAAVEDYALIIDATNYYDSFEEIKTTNPRHIESSLNGYPALLYHLEAGINNDPDDENFGKPYPELYEYIIPAETADFYVSYLPYTRIGNETSFSKLIQSIQIKKTQRTQTPVPYLRNCNLLEKFF